MLGITRRTSSGFSPNLLFRSQSTHTPRLKNKHQAALNPFSCPTPHDSPSRFHNLSHTFAHESTCESKAIERMSPKAPVADAEKRTAPCWVLENGRTVRRTVIGRMIPVKITRV